MAEQAANRKKEAAKDNSGQNEEDMAKVAADAAEATYEELKAQIDALKQDFAELSAAALRAGEQSTHDTFERVRKSARKAADQASEQVEHAADHVESMLDKAEAFARDRPAVAMALAAGAGFLLATMMSRR